MPIIVGDRVTVSGIAGVHTIKDTLAAHRGHKGYTITLGYAYGRQSIGEACPVEAWRCSKVPVDLEDFGKRPA